MTHNRYHDCDSIIKFSQSACNQLCQCPYRSASVLVTIEQVERHSYDLGLHLPNVRKHVGMERVGEGELGKDLRDQLTHTLVRAVNAAGQLALPPLLAAQRLVSGHDVENLRVGFAARGQLGQEGRALVEGEHVAVDALLHLADLGFDARSHERDAPRVLEQLGLAVGQQRLFQLAPVEVELAAAVDYACGAGHQLPGLVFGGVRVERAECRLEWVEHAQEYWRQEVFAND